MNGLFVTGTDTGVGKTVVAAALASLLTEGGTIPASYVKPAQSGTDDGDDDARDVAAWTGTVGVWTGTALGEPLAPSVAARRAGVTLTADDLERPVRQAAAAVPGAPLVVEGAGGLLVELGTDGTTCADLAERLGMAIVLVVRPGLGTLNHTALTLAAMAGRGLRLAGVVVNGWPAQPDVAARTNLAELDRLAAGALHGVVPQLHGLGPGSLAARATVAPWFTPALGGDASRAALRALAG